MITFLLFQCDFQHEKRHKLLEKQVKSWQVNFQLEIFQVTCTKYKVQSTILARTSAGFKWRDFPVVLFSCLYFKIYYESIQQQNLSNESCLELKCHCSLCTDASWQVNIVGLVMDYRISYDELEPLLSLLWHWVLKEAGYGTCSVQDCIILIIQPISSGLLKCM